MQCYPNSSAMLMRGITKQMNSRLERLQWLQPLLLQGTGGISARCRSSTKPLHCIHQCLTGTTGRQSVTHTHTTPALLQAPAFFITKNVSSGRFLCLLGELAVPDSWSLGSSNAVSGRTSSTGQMHVALAVGCIYLGLKTTGIALHDPSFQRTVGHHSAHFYWQKKSKGVPKSKHHSKATVSKTGSVGQRSRELAFCRMWQYLGRNSHILAQILILACCNLNIPPMTNTAE